jgi:hypothetical protein
MPTPRQRRTRGPKRDRRRALELLDTAPDGCTEAIILAHGFKSEMLAELISAGSCNRKSRPYRCRRPAAQCHWHPDHRRRPAGARRASMALTFLGFSHLRQWRDDDYDYDVLEDGVVVGRIFKSPGAPADRPWMWASGHNGDMRRAAFGYEPTREAALV